MAKRASARAAAKRAFARVDRAIGLVAHSLEVLGMAHQKWYYLAVALPLPLREKSAQA